MPQSTPESDRVKAPQNPFGWKDRSSKSPFFYSSISLFFSPFGRLPSISTSFFPASSIPPSLSLSLFHPFSHHPPFILFFILPPFFFPSSLRNPSLILPFFRIRDWPIVHPSTFINRKIRWFVFQSATLITHSRISIYFLGRECIDRNLILLPFSSIFCASTLSM